jgi:hypothetical protein
MVAYVKGMYRYIDEQYCELRKNVNKLGYWSIFTLSEKMETNLPTLYRTVPVVTQTNVPYTINKLLYLPYSRKQ